MDKQSWDLFRLKSIHSNTSFLAHLCFLFTPHVPFHFFLCSHSVEIAKTPLIIVSWQNICSMRAESGIGFLSPLLYPQCLEQHLAQICAPNTFTEGPCSLLVFPLCLWLISAHSFASSCCQNSGLAKQNKSQKPFFGVESISDLSLPFPNNLSRENLFCSDSDYDITQCLMTFMLGSSLPFSMVFLELFNCFIVLQLT